MASTARAAKRIKTASVSNEKKPVTSVHKQGFDASDVTVPTHTFIVLAKQIAANAS